jgi:hypothetical protein
MRIYLVNEFNGTDWVVRAYFKNLDNAAAKLHSCGYQEQEEDSYLFTKVENHRPKWAMITTANLE